jgi:hypothetical protein
MAVLAAEIVALQTGPEEQNCNYTEHDSSSFLQFSNLWRPSSEMESRQWYLRKVNVLSLEVQTRNINFL